MSAVSNGVLFFIVCSVYCLCAAVKMSHKNVIASPWPRPSHGDAIGRIRVLASVALSALQKNGTDILLAQLCQGYPKYRLVCWPFQAMHYAEKYSTE